MLDSVTGVWHTVLMLIEAARRAEAAAKETLAQLKEGTASCAEMRETLNVLRSAAGLIAAAQTSAAATVAARERHGDGGTEVLASTAGLPRHAARSHIKTAETLRGVPAMRELVETGRVSQANAKQLAAAVKNAGADAVASDAELLAKAESMQPEQFTREARRWTADRDGDDGASQHHRQRARRRVRVWDGDDGMVHLHGEFDKATGTRIANRLRHRARSLLDADKKTPGTKRRSFDQCMADALDCLTGNDTTSGTGRTTGRAGSQTTPGVGQTTPGVGGRPSADICVMVRVDDETGKLVAELPDRTRLPRGVLDALSCDAAIAGVICDRQGSPIWRSYASRGATDAQRQILFATYGGCFRCGANPGLCQIHHIEPVWLGGRTEINNLVPLCWECHNLIHEHGWWILKRTLGKHTMHPPDGPRHGPAREPDRPILYRSAGPPDEPGLNQRGDTGASTGSDTGGDIEANPRPPPAPSVLGTPVLFDAYGVPEHATGNSRPVAANSGR